MTNTATTTEEQTEERIKNVLPWNPDWAEDELIAQAKNLADEYDAASKMEKEADETKKGIREKLRGSLNVVALTQGLNPEDVDGIVLSDEDPVTKKQVVFERTQRKGSKSISAELLLKAGVPAATIEACTVQGQGSESWAPKLVSAKTVAENLKKAELARAMRDSKAGGE